MPIRYCPNCNKRYTVSFDCSDYVHECNSGNVTLDQEDVLVVGNWEDYSGSGNVPPQQAMRQGASNEFFGRRPGVEGKNKDDDTPRDNRESTHRQRQHYEFINIKNEGLN